MYAILFRRVVAGGLVVRAAIVPDHDIAFAPDVVVFGVWRDHALLQFGDQRVAFLILDADEVTNLAGIEVERLPARLGMGADNRVEDRLPVLVFRIEQPRLAATPAIGESADHPVEPVLQPL